MASRMPEFSESGKLKYVILAYQYIVKHMLTFFFVPITSAIIIKLVSRIPEEFQTFWNTIQFTLPQSTLPHSICILILIIMIAIYFSMSRRKPIYLVDYACFKPPSSYRVPFSRFTEHAHLLLPSHPKSVHFQVKMLERSGLGEETCMPAVAQYVPPVITYSLVMEETELVLFSAMDSLLKKTGLKPKDIDILVVNCSLFSPTPSLADIMINKFKLRSNIKSFNLSGMGCSAGMISVNLASDLLKVHPNLNAVVISTEILTPNSYLGKERSMLLPNCLFRMGGAALLLSNKKSDKRRAKYQFLRVVRTHKGAVEKAYKCVFEEEDPEGIVGINLNIDLMAIAGEALKSNITTLGPLVLPISEKLLFLVSIIKRKVLRFDMKPYIPDFKQAFEHFCIHAGGRAVIDELQKSLRLSAEHVEASRMTLHRFGNTSSSSLWYELSYIEAKGRMKKGDRIWQIGFGSGFKCNSAVWKCNNTVNAPPDDGPWIECIDKYPVHIPEVVKL
ncbi:hypothetical protein LIER_25944 [Lithospermum erythrorhizon]|uniref:3-ketoacyl-CoA synthase n=1 Tax=Lithospermum erythrorhizon TaxID=34254 RepID=A0AAV3RAW5_LITER